VRIRSKLRADTKEGRDLPADLERELWEVSARSRREITDKLEDGLRNGGVGLFKHVTDWQQTMKDMAKRTRQLSWLVTNIGVLDGNASTTRLNTTTATTTTTRSPTGGGDTKSGDAQRWSIGRAQFGLSTEVPAAAIVLYATNLGK